MPNFLIFGAQKSGTTTLADHLSKHPQVYMSPMKEPGFFDFENRTPDFKGPKDKELYQHMVTDLAAYQGLFSGVTDEQAIGEATTWYLYSQQAPVRIKHYLPDVKLIAILRNPVDRAYSAFLHARRDDRETVHNFVEALDQEDARIAQNWEYLWRYKQMGFYFPQLSRYFEQFPPAQIRIYLFDDLSARPTELLDDICDFLEIDAALMPEISKRYNVSGIPKNRLLHNLVVSQDSLVKRAIRPFIPSEAVRQQIRSRISKRNLSKPEMSAEAREKLVGVYREDVAKLETLIDRDLSHWLAVS